MNFENVKLLYVISCVALSLIILSPTFAALVPSSSGEKFSELWVLGPDHMLRNYPFNVSEGESYKVYLGVGNHMGDLDYYRVYVKFRNQSETLPDDKAGLPSPLEPIFEYNMFLRNDETWERELSFSFEGVSFERNVSSVNKVLIDGYAVDVNKIAPWDETQNEFYYQLFFELWIYNTTASRFQFNNCYVGLRLNITETS